VAQLHHTVEPPMKHILCRASSLADVITRTSVSEKVQGVESVTISLDPEVLVSTDLRHSIREKNQEVGTDQDASAVAQ
jgi:hypothetical protein